MLYINLQLFAKRGSGSNELNSSNVTVVSTDDGVNLARELAQNPGSQLSAMKSEIRSLREMDENNEADSDQHYWVIHKDGSEHFYQPGVDNWKDTGIDLRKAVYIHNQNGDGSFDSNGMSTVNERHDAIMQDDNARDAYESEINRIYGTEWGKRHPR